MNGATLTHAPGWRAPHERLRLALIEALDGTIESIDLVAETDEVVEAAVTVGASGVSEAALVEAVERLGFAYTPGAEDGGAGPRSFERKRPGSVAYRVSIYERDAAGR